MLGWWPSCRDGETVKGGKDADSQCREKRGGGSSSCLSSSPLHLCLKTSFRTHRHHDENKASSFTPERPPATNMALCVNPGGTPVPFYVLIRPLIPSCDRKTKMSIGKMRFSSPKLGKGRKHEQQEHKGPAQCNQIQETHKNRSCFTQWRKIIKCCFSFCFSL